MSISENNISALARSYNVLANHITLKQIVSPYLDDSDLIQKTKLDLHSIINDLLTNGYKGESRLKAKLVEMFIKKDVIAAFEMKVNSSRVDFFTVNGDTKSFEIKSNLDNLYKLEKQVSDYEKVFEYNYIVIDAVHFQKTQDIIPQQYGIYLMENEKLVRKRIAGRNSFLEPFKQLQLFTKKELTQNFRGGEPDTNKIIRQFTDIEINESFKRMLKKRYVRRWEFLKQNMGNIFPVDYQFFFHHNIEPGVIYNA